jgi:glyoxylase-like metal-dependent hydrolase (beta-lactamase superfamily II)
MDAIAVKTFVLGELSNNCYVVFDKEARKGFIVDAPQGIEAVTAFIREEQLEISFLILTHAHFDHIVGLNGIKAPFYVHEKDSTLLKNASLNGSFFFQPRVVINKEPAILKDKACLYCGNHKLEVIHTPGHTPGSISLYFENSLFSGDTIFSNSIGRTDIPLASHAQLLKSIKERILILPKDTVIYPGHGSSTTVGEELKSNPFLI